MIPTLSTEALVLHTTNYSETSVIAKIFTRQLGVRSYMLKGVRKGGGKVKQNLLQPLSYLDLVVYNNPKNQINYMKEVAPHRGSDVWGAASPAEEMTRHALRFFMTEVLYKTLREEEPMPELFDYVVDTIARKGAGNSSRAIWALSLWTTTASANRSSIWWAAGFNIRANKPSTPPPRSCCIAICNR